MYSSLFMRFRFCFFKGDDAWHLNSLLELSKYAILMLAYGLIYKYFIYMLYWLVIPQIALIAHCEKENKNIKKWIPNPWK